jgi:hypothetical protein
VLAGGGQERGDDGGDVGAELREDRTMMPSDPYERITPGMTVLDLAGDRIGTVSVSAAVS